MVGSFTSWIGVVSVWLTVCMPCALLDGILGMGPSVVAVCFLFLCVLVSVAAFGVVGGAVGMLLGGVFFVIWALGVSLLFLLSPCLGGGDGPFRVVLVAGGLVLFHQVDGNVLSVPFFKHFQSFLSYWASSKDIDGAIQVFPSLPNRLAVQLDRVGFFRV